MMACGERRRADAVGHDLDLPRCSAREPLRRCVADCRDSRRTHVRERGFAIPAAATTASTACALVNVNQSKSPRTVRARRAAAAGRQAARSRSSDTHIDSRPQRRGAHAPAGRRDLRRACSRQSVAVPVTTRLCSSAARESGSTRIAFRMSRAPASSRSRPSDSPRSTACWSEVTGADARRLITAPSVRARDERAKRQRRSVELRQAPRPGPGSRLRESQERALRGRGQPRRRVVERRHQPRQPIVVAASLHRERALTGRREQSSGSSTSLIVRLETEPLQSREREQDGVNLALPAPSRAASARCRECPRSSDPAAPPRAAHAAAATTCRRERPPARSASVTPGAPTSTSRGSSRSSTAPIARSAGSSVGRSFRLCTARSMAPVRSPSSSSRVKMPLSPIFDKRDAGHAIAERGDRHALDARARASGAGARLTTWSVCQSASRLARVPTRRGASVRRHGRPARRRARTARVRHAGASRLRPTPDRHPSGERSANAAGD